jgi:predicted glycogen debranching enzyme
MDRLSLARPSFATVEGALSREWLLTNGMGGFASGTVAQANTRRYHGLLVATLKPPLERVLMVAKADASVSYRGSRYELACNEFADGTLAPRGFEYLSGFYLDGTTPVWTFAIGDALLEQRVWMVRGENTTQVQYRLVHAGAPLALELVPLCTYRDYHAQARGRQEYAIESRAAGCTVTAFAGARAYRLDLDRGQFRRETECYWNFRHRLEAERGLDAEEDLLRPGVFSAELQPGETLTFTVSAEPEPARPQLERELERQQSLLFALPPSAPLWVRRLTLAADQFIVARDEAATTRQPVESRRGATIIAGYPWFGDWGRDTMIALPGLAVSTGRHGEAASILRTFAQHLSQGMLPNRFPDDGEAPEYNTVDATLWYFHAIAEYQAASNDLALVLELYPSLCEIIEWHQRGTRYGIQVDPVDGLLRAGEPGVQLTWMDAKVGDWVVTPRTGKAVEINALWHYALLQMNRWATALGEPVAARRFLEAAKKTAESFAAAFWCERTGCLYDVVDCPEGLHGNGRREDPAIRPNQIFAVSLGTQLLPAHQQRAVVDTCARLLLTPVGLRSLAPDDPAYVPHYQGGPLQRDGSYHQGTVWSWLLGPFAIAHHQVYGDAAYAQALLASSVPHLDEACVGSISEIFDGAAPHAPRGCFAQAWSVAETLRAWHRLARAATQQTLNSKVTHVQRHG